MRRPSSHTRTLAVPHTSSGKHYGENELPGPGTNGHVTSAHGHGADALVVAYDKIIVGHLGDGRLTSQGSVTGKQHTHVESH